MIDAHAAAFDRARAGLLAALDSREAFDSIVARLTLHLLPRR
jgi:hypothetical protein